jgi:glucose/arabinose dehydrogenase
MRRLLSVGTLSLVGLAAAVLLLTRTADSQAKPEGKPHKEFGIDKRTPWTTSKVHGSPEPPAPYRLENAFPKLKFDLPVELVAIPGTKRLAVAQQHGQVFTFENRRDAADKHPLLSVKLDVYSLAFHPKFAENGYLYVTTIEPEEGKPDGNKVVRFKLKQADPPEADPASATVILAWPGGGHTGGCIRFGPDGYLYVGVGDGSGIADQLQTGQRLDDLHSSMLRVDVDHPAAGKNYGVPRTTRSSR